MLLCSYSQLHMLGKMLSRVTSRVSANASTGKRMAESQSLATDSRAQQTGGVINLIVALTVGGLVAAFLLPIAIDELAAVDAGENWSSGAAALWGILDVMIVLAVFLFFTGVALASRLV